MKPVVQEFLDTVVGKPYDDKPKAVKQFSMHAQFPQRVFQAAELLIKIYKEVSLITELKTEQQNKFMPVDWTSLRTSITISCPGASFDKEMPIDVTDFSKLS